MCSACRSATSTRLIARECGDDVFDVAALHALAAANRAWGAATGLAACDAIAAWLARAGPERAASLGDLAALVLTKVGRSAQGFGRPAQGRSRLRGARRPARRLLPAAAHRAPPRRHAGAARRRAARRAELCAGLWRRQAGGRAGRFRRSDPRGGKIAAHARHGRMGALQARPAHRPYPRRRGAGHQ